MLPKNFLLHKKPMTANSSTAISTVNRLAKAGAPIAADTAVNAIRAATGFPDSPSLAANQAALIRHLNESMGMRGPR